MLNLIDEFTRECLAIRIDRTGRCRKHWRTLRIVIPIRKTPGGLDR